MNIVHISPSAPYNDGWGFQENLLPKYHAKLGHNVTLIVSTKVHQDGKIVTGEPASYPSRDGFSVITLPYVRYPERHMTTVFAKLDVYGLLQQLKPDFVFYHGLLSATIFDVIRYKKQRQKAGFPCCIVQDNHLDYNIGNVPKTLRKKLLRAYYRLLNACTQSHVDKIYGVTPWRKQYAEDYYRISPDKTDVLIMGADDEKIDFPNREQIRARIREMYQIADDDFLIVTGGKIDERKKIHILMEACGDMEGVKLLVFGSVLDQMQEHYQALVDRYPNIISIGWVNADAVYDYFFAADLVCFPGQHSVLWEQACASKVPCVFARWPGMDHVDNGGNAEFVDEITPQGIRSKLEKLRFTDAYSRMKAKAESELTDIYLYSEIAKKSIEILENRETD